MLEDKAVYASLRPVGDSPDWGVMRAGMPVARRYAYLDHAAVGPLPEVSSQQLVDFAEQASTHGDVFWPKWHKTLEFTRKLVAESLETTPQCISLIPSTSSAISQIAAGFPWKDRANVVSLDNEFPANERPWLLSTTAELRRVPWQDGDRLLERLLEACDRDTQIITVSWVGYATGYRLDIEQLVARAEKAGIAVLLDAIQGMGVYPLSVQQCPVHFLAADGHKWMLGPEGLGVLYVRPDWNERIHPVLNGWHNATHEFGFAHGDSSIATDGRRFEPGTMNMAGIHAFSASVQFLRDYGWGCQSHVLADRVAYLRGYLTDRLRSAGAKVLHWPAELASGIVAFSLPSISAPEFREICLAADVVLSARGGFVRASIHGYNNESDLDRLIELIP
jgi:cysteine desulfurase/selenocysteine lyase